jgi:hypothetical protein
LNVTDARDDVNSRLEINAHIPLLHCKESPRSGTRAFFAGNERVRSDLPTDKTRPLIVENSLNPSNS